MLMPMPVSEIKIAKNTDAINEQLQRILASPSFKCSERLRRFLEYSVEASLSDRADRIKAYAIATTVLGRKSDFDPQTDPIVRIEAGRLRRAIEMYYLTDGRNDPIRISIPTGGYSAVFDILPPEEEIAKYEPSSAPAQVNTADAQKSVLVKEFEAEEEETAYTSFSHGFTRQLVVALSRFRDLSVFAPELSHFNRSGSQTSQQAVEIIEPHFVLNGSTFCSSDHFIVVATLVDTQSSRVVWGETFKTVYEPGGIAERCQETVDEIARTLAQPYGVIFSEMAHKALSPNSGTTGVSRAVNCFYRYWLSFDPSLFDTAAKELFEAIAHEPDNAEACACLSQIYADSFRFERAMPGLKVEPLSRAFELARHAIEIDPKSSRGYHALAVAYWFSHNVPASVEAYETALSTNPNATELLTDYGLRLAMMGKVNEAQSMLERSIRQNPMQPGTNRLGLAVCFFEQEKFEEALSQAQQIGAPGVVYGYLYEAAALARLGRIHEARSVMSKILKMQPNFFDNISGDLEKRGLNEMMAEKLIAALQMALSE